VKGDRVEVVIDVGDGTRTFEIVASKAGRRVETATARGVVEVTEVTRTGQPVRSARFMATRVVAIVEHPLDGDEDGEARPRAGARRATPDQAGLDLDLH
jgi:hypothetical protein